MSHTTDDTLARLPEIRARVAAAPVGPWERDSRGRGDQAHQVILTNGGKIVCDSLNGDLVILEHDSEDGYTTDVGSVAAFDFIAAAREDVPALVAACEDLARRLEKSEGACKSLEQEISQMASPHALANALDKVRLADQERDRAVRAAKTLITAQGQAVKRAEKAETDREALLTVLDAIDPRQREDGSGAVWLETDRPSLSTRVLVDAWERVKRLRKRKP